MSETNHWFARNRTIGRFGRVGFFADIPLVTGRRTVPKFDNFGWLGSETANGREREGAREEQSSYQGLLHVKRKAN
jgi:hypothetical protein